MGPIKFYLPKQGTGHTWLVGSGLLTLAHFDYLLLFFFNEV